MPLFRIKQQIMIETDILVQADSKSHAKTQGNRYIKQTFRSSIDDVGDVIKIKIKSSEANDA